MFTTVRTWFNDLHINTQMMILLTGLNIVDFQTTQFLVERNGFHAEANALLYNAMVMMNSVYAIALIKGSVLALLWWIYDAVEHHHKLLNPARMTWILGVLVSAFFALITWNFYLVFTSLLHNY